MASVVDFAFQQWDSTSQRWTNEFSFFLVAVFKISVLLHEIAKHNFLQPEIVAQGFIHDRKTVMLRWWKDEKQSYIILKHGFGYDYYISHKTTKYPLWRLSLKNKRISGLEKGWKMAKKTLTLFCIWQLVSRPSRIVPLKYRTVVIINTANSFFTR